MKNKTTIYLEKSILLIIAIAPILYFNQIEIVPIKAFILGAGSWGFGCIFKIFAHQIIVVPLQNNNKSIFLTSITNGFLSGFFELLAAYVIILLMKHKFIFDYNAIISFGLAIGSLETIVVVMNKGNDLFKGTALEESSQKLLEYLENLQGMKHYTFNLLLPIIERVMATFIHISTRGLVFITVITGSAIPILIALIVFIIADGPLGYYYHLSGKLATSKGYIQIHLYLFILTAIITAIFFILIIPYKNITL
ncbi:hypothetical protein ACX8XN_08230 [Calditrichota bacterium GD2]